MKRLILACAAALCAVTAQAHQEPDEIGEASYPLTQGATATLGGDVSVTLDSVSDSRCPEDKQCIRKGGLAYNFTIRAGGRSETFTLSDDATSYAPSTVPGLSLSMDPGQPPAAAAGDAGRQQHNVTLQVARKRPASGH